MIRQLTLISLLSVGTLMRAETLLENSKTSFSDEDIKAIYQSLNITQSDQVKINPNLLLSRIEQEFNDTQLANALREEVENIPYFSKVKKFNDNQFIVNFYIQEKIKEKLNSIDLSKLAKQEYLANQEAYKLPNTIDLYHILFLKDSNMSDVSPVDRINGIHAQIKSKELSIEEAAKQYRISIANTDEAGLIKGVTFKQLPESFSPQIAKLDKGQLSDVFSDDIGYHIIYINDIYEGKVMPYDGKIKEEIINKLKERYAVSAQDTIKSQFLTDTDIKINEAALDKVLNELIR